MQKKFEMWAKRYPVKTKRLMEIIPGLVSWSLILFPIWGSFFAPLLVAYYILGFAVYWFYRAITVGVLALIGHFRLRASETYDWLGDLKAFPGWKRLHHLIILPTYKEPLSTLERTLKAIKKQTYPKKNIHIVISFEEREGKPAIEKARALKRGFSNKFGSLIITHHPDIKGEVKGKSSNNNWAARLAKRELVDKRRIKLERIMVTVADADSVLHENFLACLSYHFLDHPNRYKRIWQPAIMFYNNIWKVPAPIRVLASIWSVVHIYLLMRTDMLMNFSTYSTSLKMVQEVDYWDTDVIPEDWRFFFKSFFALKGDLEVEPIFLPVHQDAAESKGYIQTLVNQYEQIKRWAWGVSDSPYVLIRFLTVPGIPFNKKAIRIWHFIQAHFLWPVNWFAITLGAFFPPLLNDVFARTILGKTLPQVTSTLLTLALVSLAVLWLINVQRRPKEGSTWLKRAFTPLELLMMPVLGFFFNALPGLDAHTRLMLGKYIEYRVTEKV